MLSVIVLSVIIILSAIMLSVIIILSAIMLSVIMLGITTLSVAVLIVVILQCFVIPLIVIIQNVISVSVFILIVVAPFRSSMFLKNIVRALTKEVRLLILSVEHYKRERKKSTIDLLKVHFR
jgi:hypothetical protein